MRERLPFLDGLRGIAALAVVVYHEHAGGHIPSLESKAPLLGIILGFGHFGVPIFFVLSGFVIALSLDQKPMKLSLVGRFMFRRSIRLDPPYWAAIIIGITAGYIKGVASETYSVGQIASHLIYMQELFGYAQISPVFWTLCFEFQFYLLYALLMCSARQDAALLMAVGVSVLWPLHILPILSPALCFHLWHGFLLGVCAHWTTNGRLPLYVFLSFALVTCASGNSFSLTCALTSGVIVLMWSINRLDALNWRWLQGLGAISYSLYLIHAPATGAVFRIAARFGVSSVASDACWLLISLGACIAAACVMWRAIEKPSIALARRFPLIRLRHDKQGAQQIHVESYPQVAK
jgi:peptidoglycan/LPS O-acetylase OafA/YrhL